VAAGRVVREKTDQPFVSRPPRRPACRRSPDAPPPGRDRSRRCRAAESFASRSPDPRSHLRIGSAGCSFLIRDEWLPSGRGERRRTASDTMKASWHFQPKGTTSTGAAPWFPGDSQLRVSTRITTSRAAVATIFSQSSAPPSPLMRSRLGSTSSAPSRFRSSAAAVHVARVPRFHAPRRRWRWRTEPPDVPERALAKLPADCLHHQGDVVPLPAKPMPDCTRLAPALPPPASIHGLRPSVNWQLGEFGNRDRVTGCQVIPIARLPDCPLTCRSASTPVPPHFPR